jgi:hypothetical protein
MSGILDKLTERLINKGYLKHKLWHSAEVVNVKRPIPSSERPSERKHVFDNFEKVINLSQYILWYMHCNWIYL